MYLDKHVVFFNTILCKNLSSFFQHIYSCTQANSRMTVHVHDHICILLELMIADFSILDIIMKYSDYLVSLILTPTPQPTARTPYTIYTNHFVSFWPPTACYRFVTHRFNCVHVIIQSEYLRTTTNKIPHFIIIKLWQNLCPINSIKFSLIKKMYKFLPWLYYVTLLIKQPM